MPTLTGIALAVVLVAVWLKSGKTEFMLDKPQTQTCVRALFPQLGYKPCWWLAHHAKTPEHL
jgi:hypothetical protein